ncbi:MAG TPA: hypothetical protein VKA31_04625 [Mariprofundaceae bacterium]|nr:hypothetical protein [Mariprofundaceae bacterium]
MARQNFKYEKRQKELAKQKKNEEKRLRKLEKRSGTELDEPSDEQFVDATPTGLSEEDAPAEAGHPIP